MPTLTELMIKISGDPKLFLRASQRVRQEYRALERDVSIASARMSGNMVGLGRSLSVDVTLPLIAIGTAATKMSHEFGDAMTRISALVGISRDQVQAWKKDVMSLSGATGKAPKELAEALYFITSSGIETSQAMEVLSLSSKAAAVGLGETQKVADALTSVLNAYRGTSLTAAQATDILVATVREGKAEADAIAGSIGHVAAIAAEMGVSFNDVGASIGALTRVGLDSAESVTALKRILSTLLDPTKQAVKVLDAFGLSAADLRKEAQNNLIGTLLHMKSAFGNNAEAMADVFGSMKGLTGVLSLTGNQAKEVVDIFESLRNTSGDLNTAFEEASQTSGFKMRKALAELQAAAIDLGDAMEPIINALSDQISNLAQSFRKLDPGTKSLIIGMAGLAASIGPVTFLVGSLARAGKILFDTFTLLKGAQVLLGISLGATAVEAKSFLTVLQYVGIALAPAAPVIVGIAAVVAGLWALYEVWNAFDPTPIVKTSEELLQEAKAAKLSADEKLRTAKSTDILVNRLVQLHSITKPTKGQLNEMRDIMNKLSLINPELVIGFDNQSNAIIDVGKASQWTTQRLKEQAEAARIAAGNLVAIGVTDIAQKKSDLLDRIAMLKDMMNDAPVNKFKPDPSNPATGMFPFGSQKTKSEIASEIRGLQSQIAALNREAVLAKQNLKDVLSSPTGTIGGKSSPPKRTYEESGFKNYDLSSLNLPQDNKKIGKVKELQIASKEIQELFERTMSSLNAELYLLGKTSEVERATAERLYGDYAKFTEVQWEDVKATAEKIDKKRALIEQMNAEKEAAKSLFKSYKDEMSGMDQELAKRGINNRVGQVEYDFSSAGKFAKLSMVVFGISLKRAMILKAQQIDEQQRLEDIQKTRSELYSSNAEDLTSMMQRLFLLGKTTEYEKELWEVTKGRYKDLDIYSKIARLSMASEIDAKQQSLDQAAEEEARIAKTQERYQDYMKDLKIQVMEIKGLSHSTRVEILMMNDSLSQAQAEDIVRMQELIDVMKEQQDLVTSFVQGTVDVFEGMINHLWTKGFKGFFSMVVKGFQDMLKQLVLEYLKSSLTKILLRIGMGTLFKSGSDIAGAALNNNIGTGGISGVARSGSDLTSSMIKDLGSVINDSSVSSTISSLSTKFSNNDSTVNDGDYSANSAGRSYNSGGDTILINIHGQRDFKDWDNNKSAVMADIAAEIDRQKRRRGGR